MIKMCLSCTNVNIKHAIRYLLIMVSMMPSLAFPQGKPPTDKEIAEVKSILNRLQVELNNIGSTIAVNANSISNLVAEIQHFPTEKRLVDGDLFFEMKDYEKASVLYMDLIQNPTFSQNNNYHRVLFRLGESLFQIRNLVSARKYLKMVATPSAGQYLNSAIARLFEIAIQTKDFSGFDQYERLIESGGVFGVPELLYSYGKFLYHKGDLKKAEEMFLRVPVNSPPYSRARYFVGVIQSSTGRLDAALESFTISANQECVTDEDREVKAFATQAVGRIYFELGKYQEAISTFKKVDTKSSAYLQTLLDIAWTYVKMGNEPEALATLELLLMNTAQGDLALKASALRGRLLSRINDPDAATEAYNEVSSTLSPITAELDKIANDPNELKRYFDWLIERETSKFQMEVPISERTRKWLESDPDIASIVSIFGDLAKEKEDVRESLEIIEKLLWALANPAGTIEAFPALKDRLIRIKEIEAKLIKINLDTADTVYSFLKHRLPPNLWERYEDAVRDRQAKAKLFLSGPVTYDDYIMRERKIGREYLEIEKELFLIESLLKMERQQVIAVEEWLRNAQFSHEYGKLEPKKENEIRTALEEEKRSLEQLFGEVQRLRSELEREKTLGGSQTELIREDDNNRIQLLQALSKEVKILTQGIEDLTPQQAEVVKIFDSITQDVRKNVESIKPLIASIFSIAEKGSTEYQRIVLQEQDRLKEVASEISKAELDSRSFAQTEGAMIFRNVRERLAEVLFEADLGLVDMAWEQTDAVAQRLRKVNKDLTEQMKGVEEAKSKLQIMQKMLQEEQRQ